MEIGAHGFDVVEVAAVAGHFDPSHEAAVADLQQWLAEARLTLHAVAAPPGEREPMEHALLVARRIPFSVIVVPVGSPKSASKMIDRLAPLAEPLGVTIAIDSRSPSMQPVGTLVSFVERAEARVGIALDFAMAGKGEALTDAIETASEHLVSIRVPADSAIKWPDVMTTLQKVGYEGPFIVDGPLSSAAKARERLDRLFTS